MPMNGWLFVIPIICAGFGWCINRLAVYRLFYPLQPRKIMGISVQGLLPRRREAMAARVAQLAAKEVLESGLLEEVMTNPAHFQKLMPAIEAQIDHFLRVKLKQSMPVVGMFIGDKTIGQLKAVFVTELETIFPVIMKNFSANLAGEFNIERLITDKFASISTETLVNGLQTELKKEISAFLLLGAASGLLTGLLALALEFMTRAAFH
jgi:uncharacterized membrane protein YheB (UPF0754 family)